jgi:hypothetical protein
LVHNYGAFGGLGFAIVETAASFAITDFPEKVVRSSGRISLER